MSFTASFTEFYNQVKTSLADGTFAKLTLAKTIGNTDLKNIYVRPIIEEGNLKLELKFRYQEEELFEIHSIDGACEKLVTYINNPFMSAILFTTEFDLIYKLNKKRAVSITEQFPSFTHASPIILEFLRK
ncbi:MAG: hypothetical protein C0525_12815 [Flavobacterium sp.]|uniref:hypothetical protein n=1 Tax=unclassified Flavobacterium TaxID=196869 RepID=UPI000EAEC4C9|nr:MULTISPECIES: hypothetical protein [unclassified Flavobacterium]MBA4135599.1 hypothetical protein [Flavobacterium sp.]RKS01163.1 hypothetical protein C8C84_0807 [Flavobacterium sp. 102]